jgi:hypothetical protein
MRRAALLLLLVAAPARAHFFPGERAVVVQAEEESAAILVTYRPPSGAMRDALEVDARWSGLGRELVKAVLAERALAALSVRLDGARLVPEDVQVKLAEDAPGRRVVVVLLSAKVGAGRHRMEVDVGDTAELSSTRWLDRSRGRIVEFGPRPAGVPFQDRGQLVLVWAGTRPASATP